MRRVLFDSDVLLDVLIERSPHAIASVGALDTVVPGGTVEGYVSGHAVTNMYYLLRRLVGDARGRELLASLLTRLTVAPVTDRAIRTAFAAPFSDFEDAVTWSAALEVDAGLIVTRNIADFRASTLPAVTPAVYLARLAPRGADAPLS